MTTVGYIGRTDAEGSWVRLEDFKALADRLAVAEDGWHMANGTAELAMKHRDIAEARLAEAERLLQEWLSFNDAPDYFPQPAFATEKFLRAADSATDATPPPT